ncbi:hypothetical protein AO398_00425 [Methylobacterium sp. GXS13]|nr:hypothetical protein AO398_00425 [Methylobacterium sp. GXS13]
MMNSVTYVFDGGTFDFSEGAGTRASNAGADTLLPLDVAIWTEELADPDGFPTFTTAQLRAATVAAPPHRLKSMRPGHAIYTTRRHLSEWRESWHAPEIQPDCTGTPSARSGASATTSTAENSSAALDTAATLARRLKASSRSISRNAID